MSRWHTIAIAACLAFAVIVLADVYSSKKECEKKGGILVRPLMTFSTNVCIKQC